MMAKPRVFVSQPIASSALDRLRAITTVKINTDSSKIIAKPKLIAAVKKCDILFSLLHDRIDRAVLAANPKLRAVCSMSITPDNIDVAEATKRSIPVTVVPPIVAEATADIHFGLILAVARRMMEGDKMVRAGRFRARSRIISLAFRSTARRSAWWGRDVLARQRRGVRAVSG